MDSGNKEQHIVCSRCGREISDKELREWTMEFSAIGPVDREFMQVACPECREALPAKRFED